MANLCKRCPPMDSNVFGFSNCVVKEEAECIVLGDMPPLKKAKTPSRYKGSRLVIEPPILASMVVTYNRHFAEYCMGRKQVSQLIPNFVWKAIYKQYKEQYPYLTFQEESLKDRLRETLKELKSGSSGEEKEQDPEKVRLENEEVLSQLRRSELKKLQIEEDLDPLRKVEVTRKQSIVEQRSACVSGSNINPTIDGEPPETLNRVPWVLSQEKEKSLRECEVFAEQAMDIPSMDKSYTGGQEHWEKLMSSKIDTEKRKASMLLQKEKSIKMNDLFKLRDAGVFTQEEFIKEAKALHGLGS